MTEFAPRAPLQTLSMSSSQRASPPRRRSARLAFEDEDEEGAAAGSPSSKRAKLDAGVEEPGDGDGDGAVGSSSSAAQLGLGRKGAAAKKGKKAAYNEDIDGFTFARSGKSKKGAVASKQKPASPSTKQQPARQSPARKHSPPRRRSARLSGDKVSDKASEEQRPAEPTQPAVSSADTVNGDLQAGQPSTNQDIEKQASQTEPEERGRARTPAAVNELHVEKTRAPTKIALPFADTPVMARNKAMRKSSAENRRRSSSQMRGRRASSLIDSGASNALPHDQVPAADFYKHINQDLTEPRRMKQLLVWCGTRALPDRPTGPQEDVNAALAARVIQEEIVKGFSTQSEMSDWFSREDIAPTALIKRPNPRNVQNATKLQELEREVERLKQEQASWDTILGELSSSIDREDAPSGSQVDPSKLSATDHSSYTDLASGPERLKRQKERLEAATTPIEFKLDHLAERVHKLAKFKTTTDKQVDDILSESAQALEERGKTTATNTGSGKVGVRELLRSLSRAT